jgi:hypothetical protein
MIEMEQNDVVLRKDFFLNTSHHFVSEPRSVIHPRSSDLPSMIPGLIKYFQYGRSEVREGGSLPKLRKPRFRFYWF